MVVTATASAQSIWYVTPTGGNATGSGISWNYPCSLPMAVQQAVDGDQIWVKQGTYKVNLIIDKNLKIFGGFNGTETTLSDRVLSSIADYTVLMPRHIDSLSIINVNPDPRYRHPDSTLFPNRCHHIDSFLIDGFTLKGGSFSFIDNHHFAGWGAAIRTDSVNRITLKNLWIDSNTAFKGGGVYIENSAHGWMENVLFTRNSAQSLGGGVFLSNCYDFKLINIAFTNNESLLEGEAYPGTQHSGGFYFEAGDFEVHNMTATDNIGEMAGSVNMADVRFYNSIIWPDHVHVFYNHDNSVSYHNCCLWTTSLQGLQGLNPIPVNGNWNNVVWDYDIHNTIITDNVFSTDPLFDYIMIIPNVLYLPGIDPNSPCKDAAGTFEVFYPGGAKDVILGSRLEDIMDLGALEHHQDIQFDRTLRLHAATDDDDRYIYVPLPSADTAVYYITSDSTVSAGSPTTHYFLNHKNIKEPNVVIPETVEYKGRRYRVTSLSSYAFRTDSITSVTLPKCIETIASHVFEQSTVEHISPLYCKKISGFAFYNCKQLKHVNMSRCTFDTLQQGVFHSNYALQWVKLPKTLVSASSVRWGYYNFGYQMKSLKFVLLPPSVREHQIPVRGFNDSSSRFPTILLSPNPPYTFQHTVRLDQKIWFPCMYDSIYYHSNWGDRSQFDSIKSCHLLNLDSGYVDLDSVCPWEAERRYGFHPDSVGLYIVQKSNPDGCDSFNIYFVKSFLDPGMILDTTIQLEVNKQDTSVLWTWEGNAFAYNVYRDGDYLTTVEQPAFADSDIRVNVQYCYNFAPVNEKGCEGKWSTTNCYTMPADSTGIRERGDRRLVIHPNPAKEVLFISTVTDRASTSTAEKSSLGATANSFNDSKTVASAGSETVPASAKHHNNPPYEVTDITGRIVLQGQYDASEGIPVGNLAKGMYLLRLEGLVGKFVKE